MKTDTTPQQVFFKLRDLYYSGYINTQPHDLFANIVFSENAKQTFMMSVGFIISTYYGGNIQLAYQLAYNLHYQIQSLVPTEHICLPGDKYGHTYKEISSDHSGMSFLFTLRKEITQEEAEKIRNDKPNVYIHEVKYYIKTQYFYNALVGGIIFHGERKMHCLESQDYNGLHARWWCTHT